MQLLTQRLLLRDFQTLDCQDVHEYNTDPEVFRHMPSDPGTIEDTYALVQWCIEQAHVAPRLIYDLAVELTVEQKVIGWCRFAWREDELRQGEIAYLLNRHYWGQGLATEVAQELLRFGFQTLHAHRIFATARPANRPSWRVLEKVGMQREGHLRQHRWMKEAWHDSYLYAMLEHEWSGNRADS
ncbi:MAG: GNAT family N-acetyltransferase [Chloroflexota bacterium]|nr:GNAT family N-acetyltransferase [Chloroflexota bacterium]